MGISTPVKLFLALVCLAFLSGCAKHGMAVATGEDFKGRISVGWGPMAVLDADVAGQYMHCIPSKEALKEDLKWCDKLLEGFYKQKEIP